MKTMMIALLTGLMAAFALSGCGGSSAPVEVQIDQEVNPLNPDGSKPWYPEYLTYVHIRAIEDSVKVTDASINRGNCKVSHWFSHPDPLPYGQEIKGQLSCDQDNVKEVSVTTDQDTYTFNF
ncbi:hypothetical protein [Alkanindiges illinoisensis]|uniref:hypothetical protein n=1 Tax=Alkanindiges illinoisensis TaxID=197183 RepID=UPI000479A49A|nr:hypothetical protein [Alkanindiges illinoisensis]